MPYINPSARADIMFGTFPASPGELNYRITQEIWEYIRQYGECYSSYNEVIGVLECAKLELYRRMIGPYEDRKCQENGDVYV